MTLSRCFRRIETIARSEYEFCHGDRVAEITSSMLIIYTIRWNDSL